MLNQYSDGNTLAYTNHLEDTIPGGSLVVSGSVCGVAIEDIPPQETGALLLSGVYKFRLAAATGAVEAQGTKIYVSNDTVFTDGSSLTFNPDNGIPVGVLAFGYHGTGRNVYVHIVPFALGAGGGGGAVSPTITVEDDTSVVPNTHTLTITDVEGVRTTVIRDGAPGADGVSPTVNITNNTSVVPNTHTITITDKNGPHSTTVSDGKNDVFTDITTSTAATLTVTPGTAYTWTPEGNGTLQVSGGVSGKRSFASVDIVLNASNTITLSGLTWATPEDTLIPSTVNHCVVTFDGTTAFISVCAPNAVSGGGGSVEDAVRHVSSTTGLESGDVFVWDAASTLTLVQNHIYRKETSSPEVTYTVTVAQTSGLFVLGGNTTYLINGKAYPYYTCVKDGTTFIVYPAALQYENPDTGETEISLIYLLAKQTEWNAPTMANPPIVYENTPEFEWGSYDGGVTWEDGAYWYYFVGDWLGIPEESVLSEYTTEDVTITQNSNPVDSYTDLQAVGITASTAASLSLAAADEVVDWSPVGDCTLASVPLPAAGIVQSWELRLALASDATLTLGEGISFATDAEGTQDAVTGGAINILLVRATSAGATVYVCGTEAAT